MGTTVALISLGCAKNLVNSEQMARLLTDAGFSVSFVPSPEGVSDADVAIVNTCGFITSAKEEAIDTILDLAALKDEGRVRRIIAAGCLPERYQDEIAQELPEVDAFVGVGGFGDIVAVVRGEVITCADSDRNTESAFNADYGDGRTGVFPPPEGFDDDLPRAVSTPGAWAYLKVADGCDNRCAFCAIPDIRGYYRSRTIESIVEEAEALAANSVRELIIIAQDTTRYGLDLYGERMLAELLRELCKIEDIRWIRVHYMYPDSMTDELIETIAAEEKILKYLDIPIQHINDGILKAMNRRGTGGEIRELFKKLRERIPGVVLRTSLIAGLPGEGEAEFEELCGFLSEARIERAGVFPYSPEDGTRAETMERPDFDTAVRRAEMIEELQSRVMDDFNASRVGKIETVLIEGIENGQIFGRSFAESPDIDGVVFLETGRMESITIGDFVQVKITGSDGGDAVGEIQ